LILRSDAAREGETPAQALRHHLLAGVIERVGRTTGDFVLRGSMLTRAWIAPVSRPARDLDYVGDFAFDVDDTVRRFAPALACELDDGVCCDPSRLIARGIWLDTAFPGVHLEIPVGLERADQVIGVDIGFGDPLVPAPVVGPGGGRAVRPETQLAWKLHALVEMRDAWRPKDLRDLWLIATRVSLVADDLALAIVPAFESRGYPIRDACDVFDSPRWATKSARVRWGSAAPELARAIAEVRERLEPALTLLRSSR
jgi:hypothetical protein